MTWLFELQIPSLFLILGSLCSIFAFFFFHVFYSFLWKYQQCTCVIFCICYSSLILLLILECVFIVFSFLCFQLDLHPCNIYFLFSPFLLILASFFFIDSILSSSSFFEKRGHFCNFFEVIERYLL